MSLFRKTTVSYCNLFLAKASPASCILASTKWFIIATHAAVVMAVFQLLLGWLLVGLALDLVD